MISLDLDLCVNATYCCDVSTWDHTCVSDIDVIWASPPCTFYSRARSRGPRSDLETSDDLVLRTLDIVAALGNPPLFLENPHSGQLKSRGIIPLPMKVVDYCRYGMPYRKRTAIWTSTAWEPARPLCRHDCAASDGKKHLATAQRGSPGPCFTQQELYRIPAKLREEIAHFCNGL